MTSRKNECFVYITFPGQTKAVTAGRFELTTNRNGIAMGRFVYGKRYLGLPDAIPLDPIELKLAGKVFQTTALNGVFGAIRDAGPDFWGRLIIERHLGRPNLDEITISSNHQMTVPELSALAWARSPPLQKESLIAL